MYDTNKTDKVGYEILNDNSNAPPAELVFWTVEDPGADAWELAGEWFAVVLSERV